MGALTELVGKARRGSVESKLELEEHLRPLVHGVLLGWLPHGLAGQQVRGLISDAFGAILSEDARFIPTMLQRVRGAGQALARQRPDAVDPVAGDPGLRDAMAVLARLRRLPERERERLALRLIEGIPGSEIAEALGTSDAEVGTDLERGLTLLQEGGGSAPVALKNDAYLWSLAGAPHPVVVRLENLLTPLRYDDTAQPADRDVETNPDGVPPVERTPVSGPVPVPATAEGRRGTSEHKPQGAARGAPNPSAVASGAPTAVGLDPRRSAAGLGIIPSGAPTAVGLDPRRSAASLKPFDGPISAAAPVREPEPTDPPSARVVLPTDDEMDERTEALLPVPGRANPFEQQPGTLAAQNLPAAAQVNPYSGMPGTVAANDLPAAAQISPGVAAPMSSWVAPPGKRPTNASLPQQPPVLAVAVRPTAAAPPSTSVPAIGDDERPTGARIPGALPLDAEGGGSTRLNAQVPLEQGESMTRVQPIKPPVHWKSVLFAEDDDEASITLPVPERNKLLRRKGVWRGRAPFAISGMLATLGIAITWMTLSSVERRSTRMWNLVPVTVAATDLSEGTVVTLDKISTRAVPEQFVTASVVKPDGYGYVVGQKLLVPVQAGDPLLWSCFEMAQTTERLSRRVNKRARAISLTTGRTTSVGGWVRPGDWVDLIVSLKEGARGNNRAAVTLVQDVPVIATGKISEKTNYGILNPGQREYQHVSLLLLPEEVEMVALAKDIGHLQLTLRNDADHDVARDGYGSSGRTLLDGARVKLLQIKRLATIQTIREAPVPVAPPSPLKLRIEPVQ